MSDPNQWAIDVLTGLGMPTSPENVNSVTAYAACGGASGSDYGSSVQSAIASLDRSPVALALSHNSPRPVFGSALGGSVGNCVQNKSSINLAGIKLPPLIGPPDPTGTGANKGGNPLTSLAQIGSLLATISKASFWVRVGEFLLGGILLLVGLYMMVSESNAGQRLKSQAESAAVVAAVA